MATLSTKGLTKSYSGRTVVKGVELEIASGEVVGLLGPNGAGKTTTFSMVVGLASPDSGRVLLDGADVTDLSRSRQGKSSASWARTGRGRRRHFRWWWGWHRRIRGASCSTART